MNPTGAFLRELAVAIHSAWKPEAELTMRVAVMSAGGMTRAEIVSSTGATELEVKMALLRLSKVCEGWR